jgi:hypothetical protein
MNLKAVERIVNAVLYEGYILYPYRASAVKNRQRFNFGAIFPEPYSVSQKGAEPSSMQTECLLMVAPETMLEVKVRFLHLLSREVGKHIPPRQGLPPAAEPRYEVVNTLQVGDRLFQTWEEAVEREVDIPKISINELLTDGPRQFKFGFPSSQHLEQLHDEDRAIAGVIVRTQWLVAGAVEVTAEPAGDRTCKVTVRIQNLTALGSVDSLSRDAALMRSLVSAHTILGVSGGEFLSLLDPPEGAREAAAGCRNIGTWPVLVGEEGERDCMLSSPIILYDYPQIAPESPGDLFDGTEIDEILTLRIMTLTDEEKREMRGVDERARQILERTERIPAEEMAKLHGAVRSMRRVQEDRR